MKVIRRTKDVFANGMQLGVRMSCARYKTLVYQMFCDLN